jgi:MFS family permease
MSASITAVAPHSASSRRYASYVVGILILANILSIADRGIMGLLLEPIKRDLHASDTSMSLLTGASFVLFYSLFGIPIARWADTGSRRGILAVGVAVWSLMTALCGLAGNFLTMALARAGVGVGEATCSPTSMSLIADYYARKARPKVIALFNMAASLSAFIVTPIIAIIADHYGWRAAFLALGVPGVIVALLVRFTIREPKRGGMDEATPPGAEATVKSATFMTSLRVMWASKPFMLILVGTAITSLGGSTLAAWGPALMMRAYSVSATEVSATMGPIGAVAGILGGIGGGFVTGWLASKRKSERWVILLPALVSLITIPAGVLFAWAPSFWWMVLGGIGGAFTIAFRTAPYLALSLELVPAHFRGIATAASLIASTVVGQALGPLAVGIISDIFTPTVGPVMALRYGMLFAPLTLALGVIPFFAALKYYDASGLKPEATITPY